jgi:hypothetical protein
MPTIVWILFVNPLRRLWGVIHPENQVDRMTIALVLLPAAFSFTLGVVAAWRVGRNRNRLRGDGIAMIAMSVSAIWLLGGGCILTVALAFGDWHRD